MRLTKGKSRKLIIYQDKRSGALFICPTKVKNGRFIIKSPTKDYGIAKSSNIPNEELGRYVKKFLKDCD